MSPDALSRAEQYFRRAVQIDPQYAAAWAGIGLAVSNRAAASGRNPTAAELAETKDLYRKALSLDPALTSTRANLGMIELRSDWDWAAAERELESASRAGPDAGAEVDYGLLLSFRGRFREADQHLDLARALSPMDSAVSTNMIMVRGLESRYTEAIALARQLLERYPNQLNPNILMNLSYIEAGQAERALENLRPLEARFPPARLFEVMALGKLGRNEEGLRLLHQLEGEYEKDTRVYRQWFALACVALGDHAGTLKWLERSADLHEFQILNVAVHPAFAPMRNDPGFRALLKRIGLK
jgi:tetratricopeptide (TPR) repeat protein